MLIKTNQSNECTAQHKLRNIQYKLLDPIK